MHSAIALAMQRSTIPVEVVAGAPKREEHHILVPITAALPPNSLQFVRDGDEWRARFDLFVSVFDQDGNNLGVQHETRTVTTSANTSQNASDLRCNLTLKLSRGRVRVVVAIRDPLTEAIGIAGRDLTF